MSTIAARLAATAMAIVGLASGAAAATDLPDPECLRQIRRARIEAQRGDLAAAATTLKQAVEAFPDQIYAVLALVDMHRRHGVLEPAELSELRARVIGRLADAERPVSIAELRYALEVSQPDLQDLERIERVIAGRPDLHRDPPLLAALATVQQDLGRLERARETIERIIALTPESRVIGWAILLDQELGRWESVVTGYQAVAPQEGLGPELRPAYLDALARLGRHDDVMRELEAWMPELQKSKLLGRTMQPLLLKLGFELLDHGRNEQARRVFVWARELQPENKDAQATLVYLYGTPEQQARYAREAQTAWEEEDDVHALLTHAVSLLAARDDARAYELLERAVELQPGNDVAWYNLGVAASRLKEWDRAERALGRAFNLNASRVEALLARGTALHNLERCEEAIRVLELALELREELYQPHFYLSSCYKTLGNTDKADEHFRLYNQR